MAERLQLTHEALRLALGVTPREVVATRVAVELARREHVPAGAEHRVLDGAEGAPVPEARAQAPVERLQVAAVGARGGHGGLRECLVQPLGALARAPRAALAGGLVVAGALPRPGGEVTGGGEAANVEADLGEALA